MIKRTILPKLIAHLDNKEITVIAGPRQAGKTTLMYSLKEHVEKKGFKTLYINLDVGSSKEYFNSQTDFINYVNLQVGKDKAYIFIDEIQRITNAGLFLKGLYDSNLPYKLVVSGSGSMELKEKIKESLTGRKRIFEIGTISFEEFVNYKTDYKYADKIQEFFMFDNTQPTQLLNEYLKFGGYPKVITSETLEEKTEEIKDIYESYLEKDIRDLLKVQKSESFTKLVTIIASQIGKPINYSELSNTLEMNTQTVKDYLWYLKKTFVLEKVVPYFGNVRKELTKMPLYYFEDLGLRNYALNRFTHFGISVIDGFLFQNLVLQLLKTKFPMYKAFYWRTRDGSEVDFVLTGGVETIPVEVKYTNIRETTLTTPRSVVSFIETYKPKKAYIVNLALDKTTGKKNGTEIEFIPYYKLLG
ncbi:MAG: hypothetical protein ACD_22C00280G0002 [uncultured bacterium]|nr:MAG: hypothetical protein ACD_22C00280G0002 [uncultured bacterium]